MPKQKKERVQQVFLPDLHPIQREIFLATLQYRFVMGICSRRLGKTFVGVFRCVDVAAQGGKAWWVAPSYQTAGPGYELLTEWLRDIPNVAHHKTDMGFVFPGGGSVWVKTAADPHQLRGPGLDFVVLDEAAFMHPATWYSSIRPTLLTTRGSALILSTPWGRNYLWDLYQQGLSDDPLYADYQSLHYTIYDNPMLSPEEIERERRETPEMVWQQEFMAEFIDDAGLVFRHVDACATAPWSAEPQANHVYIGGADLGRHNDYSWLTMMDATTQTQVDMDRFNQLAWTTQRERIIAMHRKWNPRVWVVEQNSVGEPNIEELRKAHVPVRAFNTSTHTKKSLIENLVLAFEKEDLRIFPDQQLLRELKSYEQRVLPSGVIQYGAPKGVNNHDDGVMSLALAWDGVRKRQSRPVRRLQVAGLYAKQRGVRTYR